MEQEEGTSSQFIFHGLLNSVEVSIKMYVKERIYILLKDS